MSSGSDPKASSKAPIDERVGTVLAERYRLDELLGEGGMGKVYAAEHVMMRKKLAVKVLRHELSTVPEVIARFEREAMAAANIDHPNIAAATDFGKLADGSVFLVLEFVEGKSLRDEIAAGPMPVERAFHIARQIAGALAGAHTLKIVHRDLKPENVMLVARGADTDFVKVLDFGIAKVPIGDTSAGPLSAGPITKAGMVFGTPEYMAPEQALGQNVDGRADLYALGVIAFEMLSGVRPFSSQSQIGILGQQLSKPAPSISDLAPKVRVPKQAEQVVMKLLAKEVGLRYQTADEVVEALDELLRPPPGQGATRFTMTSGSPTAVLGSIAQVFGSGGGAPKPVNTGPKATPPRASPPRPAAGSPTIAASTASKYRAATPAGAPAPPAPAAPAAPAAPPIPALPPSVERAIPTVEKPTFMPSDPLPAFTFPAIDAAQLPRPPTAGGPAAAPPEPPPTPPKSSLEVAVSKPTFLPNEPLPSFTFPALDEEQVRQLTQKVAEARALPPPSARPAQAAGELPALPKPPGSAAGSLGERARELLGRVQRSKLPARLLASTRAAGQRAGALARQWIATACTFIDSNRSRLPERVRHALRNVKAGVILAVVATLVWAALLLCMILLLGGSRSEDASPEAKAEPTVKQETQDDTIQREIDEAKKQGHAALEKLADRHPTDGRVLLELAASHAAKSNYSAAVTTVGKALTAQPKLNEDARAAEVLAAAVRQKETTNDAFALLEEPMGGAGATALYDLSIDPKVKISVRARAETWIRSARFKEVAPPDVQTAGALRYSRSCTERHELLPKAAEVGEKRTLAYLNVLKVRGGCGRGGRTDCFPCLRKDDLVKETIANIEKRMAEKK